MASEEERREDARRLVEEVAFEEQGSLPEEEWAMLSAHSRERFRSAMKIKDDKIASSVTTLAKNLYSSNARFVFELLQNADDNCFKDARDQGHTRYVAFKVYRNRIIVDCNEDGFTEKNLRAICDVGKSSKNTGEGGQRYIGEKGIGFKSVFMAAWKVHINSGYLSFHFENRREDNGLGMICPRWDKEAERLDTPLTRMTLLLHDNVGQELLDSQRQTIRQQFDELRENLLLFLRNLQEIRIEMFDDEDKPETSTVFSKGEMSSDRVTLTKSVKKGDEETRDSTIYYVVTHTVGNLPRNENRKYSEFEEQTEAYAQADVVLAFPLYPDSTPIEEPQSVFAFLPMKHAGFSFLIQGDFVTEANRQGIVTTSQRNLGLLRGIGEAFIKAVQRFCNHETLRYTWMRFLPKKQGHHYDPFWSQLVTIIEEDLRRTPLLRPWNEQSLRPISELCQNLPCVLDSHGQPLFRDLSPGIYLSVKYSNADVEILKGYGMSAISQSQVLDLLDEDLGQQVSRIKSDKTEDDWHTRAAELLSMTFDTERYNFGLRHRLQSMPLLPLQDGTWVSTAMNGNVYFSESGGISIPGWTGLNLISSKAEKNPKRMDLFKHLGARSANVDFVRGKILERHGDNYGLPTKIEGFVNHLRFLYLTHHLASHPMENRLKILFVSENRRAYSPHRTDLYLPDDHEFGAKKLLGSDKEGSESKEKPSLQFIHKFYLDNIPDRPNASVGTWQNWMCSYAGVRRLVPLVTISETLGLSSAVYYVAKYCPDKFLGFLRHHWPEDGAEIERTPDLRKKLGKMQVLCQGGGMEELSMTYLALPDLKEKCSRFLKDGEEFPFLKLPTPVERGDYAKEWGFLVEHIGVRIVDNVFFYLSILYEIRKTEAGQISDEERIIRLYSAIYGAYIQSSPTDNSWWKKLVQTFFADQSAIYVPSGRYGYADWATPSQCLWNAPSCLTSKYPLKARVEKLFPQNPHQASSTKSLCLDLLGIPDCTWSNILEELKQCKEQGCEDFDKIETLYKHLRSMALEMEDADKIRLKAEFQNDALIYLPNSDGSCWHTVSKCLWSSATRIQGKTVLDKDYEDLYDFFVQHLGVDTLNLRMVYDDLIHLGDHSSASVERAKDQIWVLNDLIDTSEDDVTVDPGELRKARVFPVKSSIGAEERVRLCSAATDFAIIDRTHLGGYFEAQIKTLDFNFDEVRNLSPLLSWLRLEDRYLSRNVIETSSVSGADEWPILPSDCIIRSKAHALCRVAFHYQSLRLETASINELHNTLKSVQIFQTDGIHCEVHLSQDGKSYSHVSSRSDLHYREDGSLLQIFIPRNKKRRDFCYARKLPHFLFEWLMRDPPAPQTAGIRNEKGHRLVATILNSSWSVLPEILEEDGIATIDIEDAESDAEEGPDSDAENGLTREQATPVADDDFQGHRTPVETGMSEDITSLNTPTPSTTTTLRPRSRSTTYEETSYVEARTQLSAVQAQPQRYAPGSPAYPPPSVALEVSTEDERTYRRLLQRVVTAARQASLPTQGPLDMSSLQDALPNSGQVDLGYDSTAQSVRFRSIPQLERDRMIGAAGELHAFELLNALDPALPGFSIDNWESTIRHYVNLHPDYRNIERLRATEMADIIYNDTEGALTRVLIDHGCLDETWRQHMPNYLLEVKSTTGPCEAAFFMSRRQYQLIHEYHNSRETVYVILRVFNLGKESVGMRVYINPAELEASGQLVFTAGEWTVVPRS